MSFSRVSLRAVSSLLFCALAPACAVESEATTQAQDPLTIGALVSPLPTVFAQAEELPGWEIRGLANRCFDVGASPVVGTRLSLARCNGTAGQRLVIDEIDTTNHFVVLKAGNLCVGTRNNAVTAGAVLELQNCALSFAQIYRLDGDSIINANNRDLVVEAQQGRLADRTPLVLGKRVLDDGELFSFRYAGDANRRPTTGFKRFPQDTLDFVALVEGAGPGTVIEMDPRVPITMKNRTLHVGPGVTIRGGRKGTEVGAEISAPNDVAGELFFIEASDVRITGLRLVGPTNSQSKDYPKVAGVKAFDYAFDHVFIDHNEFLHWTSAGVSVQGNVSEEWTCPAPSTTRRSGVRVVRNSLHDNRRDDAGYGVVSSYGAFPLIEGNTFSSNRHAIAADGRSHTGYRALYNLVLDGDAPLQGNWAYSWYTQDFDMHGRDNGGFFDLLDNGRGGRAGDYVEIGFNTFLGTNRENFDLRGQPCQYVDYHHNVSMHSGYGTAINNDGDASGIHASENSFQQGNPLYTNFTEAMRGGMQVGDFDGDGRDDVFVATGSAWYYSSAGLSEWRLLARRPQITKDLRFGDFDGDGITDVFFEADNKWYVSSGGQGPWTLLKDWNAPPPRSCTGRFAAALCDAVATSGVVATADDTTPSLLTVPARGTTPQTYSVVDINGDGVADILTSVGNDWQYSLGGRGPWVTYATLPPYCTMTAQSNAFGDFTGDRKTDIACRRSDETWMLFRSDTLTWGRAYNGPQTSGYSMVADVDGDGPEEIIGGTWVWHVLGAGASWPEVGLNWGRFDTTRGKDTLFFGSDGFFRLASLNVAARTHSRQRMR